MRPAEAASGSRAELGRSQRNQGRKKVLVEGKLGQTGPANSMLGGLVKGIGHHRTNLLTTQGGKENCFAPNGEGKGNEGSRVPGRDRKGEYRRKRHQKRVAGGQSGWKGE